MFILRSECRVTSAALNDLTLLTELALAVFFCTDVPLFTFLTVGFLLAACLVDDFAFEVFVFDLDVDFFVVVEIHKSLSSLHHF